MNIPELPAVGKVTSEARRNAWIRGHRLGAQDAINENIFRADNEDSGLLADDSRAGYKVGYEANHIPNHGGLRATRRDSTQAGGCTYCSRYVKRNGSIPHKVTELSSDSERGGVIVRLCDHCLKSLKEQTA